MVRLFSSSGGTGGPFFPQPEASLPIELKRELFPVLAQQVAGQLRKRGLTEKKILADFKAWRKRRAARRGR